MRLFAFRLALACGEPDVDRLLGRLSSRQLSEWMAYDAVEPLPDPWRQTGLLAALMANLWGDGRPRRPEEFIPARHAPDHVQSAEEGMAILDGG